MHSRAIKQATMHYLQTFWDLDECEINITAPPGKPLGCVSPWFIAVFDMAQTFEGKLGYYPRYGCTVTLSARFNGERPEDLNEWLDKPGTGFNDVKDALTAFLHKNRWTILEWANKLANAEPLGGLVTNMVESPLPRVASLPTLRGPDWWGESFGATQRGARTEESRLIGASCDINYGGALTMQTESPEEY